MWRLSPESNVYSPAPTSGKEKTILLPECFQMEAIKMANFSLTELDTTPIPHLSLAPCKTVPRMRRVVGLPSCCPAFREGHLGDFTHIDQLPTEAIENQELLDLLKFSSHLNKALPAVCGVYREDAAMARCQAGSGGFSCGCWVFSCGSGV